ncbi:hypothetical protein HZH66_001301 [Vespula vulgaris]|uniref:CAAX prenyl protease n=1 Tax=Vespula vulgaris TaxID=7454 RepID=A0A834KU90_VESVU|nr:CAAX prenyl protease 1 homolog [Vespula vulgaris]XP_050860862.1 CAAX prenyl protease 1 homolog [Vespula vulgaris]KAF7412405.1 hypothetical protein HZH66_001301 [Vespula vulgaris]
MSGLMAFLEENIRYELLILIWVLYFWDLYLNLRQRKLLQRLVDIPDNVKSIMTKDVYDKSRLYALDKNSYSLVQNIYTQCFNTILLLFFVFYYYWEWSIQLSKYFGLNHENEIIVSAVCIFIKVIISDIIDLPLNIYDTFVLEEKHGFNKQKPLFFIKDQLLKLIVLEVIVVPLMSGVIWIVKNGGDYFFFYLWAFSVVVTLFMMIIYPEVIAPLFDKYTPLPEGDLKQKIEALAASLNFPLYKLYLVEGSKRSSHSNAYMYGFYKHKRIVLFDTLVKEYYKPDKDDAKKDIGCETDEVLGVLAHELAHWKFNHTLKGFLLSQINFIITFVVFAKLMNYKAMYVGFGFEDSQPILIGFIIVTKYILFPLNTIMQFISVVIMRRFEFQADKLAVKLGYSESLKKALIKLQKDNLQYPLYDKLYSAWNHSHPPILQRLSAIDKKD